MSERTAAIPTDSVPTARRRRWLLLACLWPLCLLWPCLTGARTFLPYDLAQFPPAALLRADTELAALRAESNFDITETPIWFVPELQRARRTIVEEGAPPDWHPTARTGTALLAHGHDAMLYPPVWPALFAADPASRLGLVACIDLTIAALLMFGFLRALGLLPVAAGFGALALCASSTLCANAHNYSRLASLVWLPGMLWGLRAAADGIGWARARALTGFAACFALTWYGGFPPFAMPSSLCACGYALALTGSALRRDRGEGLRCGLAFLAAIGLGGLLAALYVLPAFAFFASSARPLNPDLQSLSQVTFDPFGLLGYLAPDLFGRPDLAATLPYDRNPLVLLLGARTQWDGKPLVPNFNATEYAVYGGALVLWLALAGIGHRAQRHRAAPWLLLLGMLGMAAFVLPLAYLFLLPGVRVAAPLRFVGPCATLVAWLAAQGLDLVLRHDLRRRLLAVGLAAVATALLAWRFAGWMEQPTTFADWQLAERVARRYAPLVADPSTFTAEVVTASILRAADGRDHVANGAAAAAVAAERAGWFHLGAGALLLLLWGKRRLPMAARPLVPVAIVLATAAELFVAAQSFDRGIERAGSDWTPVHDFLVQARRDAAATGGFMIARAGAADAAGTLPPPTALPPGTLGPHDIRDLQVYTYFDSRSAVPLQRLCSAVDSARGVDTSKGYVASCLPDDPRVLQHPLLDLLGVRFVLATTRLQHAGPRVGPELRGPGGEFFVHERRTALPRAFVLERLELRADDDAVLAALVDGGFEPRRTAYATRDDVAALGLAALPAADPRAAQRPVAFARDHATAIDLAVGDGPPGWLLLADTMLPGWTASIDGTAAPVLRADHALRAVALPAGPCTVAFRYAPPGRRAGLLLSATALLTLLAIVWRARISSRAERRADTAM